MLTSEFKRDGHHFPFIRVIRPSCNPTRKSRRGPEYSGREPLGHLIICLCSV